MFHLPGICLFSARLIMSHAMHLQGAQGPGPRDDFLCLSPSSLFRQAANASHEADLMLLQWVSFSSAAQLKCDIQEIDCQARKSREKYATLNHDGLIRLYSSAKDFWFSQLRQDKKRNLPQRRTLALSLAFHLCGSI